MKYKLNYYANLKLVTIGCEPFGANGNLEGDDESLHELQNWAARLFGVPDLSCVAGCGSL